MEIDILDSLEDFGYEDDLLNEETLKTAIDAGTKSTEFTKLTSWLSKKLKILCNLDDYINPITDEEEESSSFLLEVSSFLKELGCPHDCLTEGPINERLNKRENRVILLDFLCSELHAACLICSQDISKQNKSNANAQTPAECLQVLIDCFKVDVDGTESTLELFININSQVEKVVSQSPELVLPPLLTEELSDSEWESLQLIHNDMYEEYQVRRQMLLTRLDVTIQSFKWGENSKGKEDKIMKVYQPRVAALSKFPDVTLCDVLSARENIAVLNKTSCAEVRKNTRSLVNTIIIGEVPDRGGRPGEQRPPVEETGWSKKPEYRGSGPATAGVPSKRLRDQGGLSRGGGARRGGGGKHRGGGGGPRGGGKHKGGGKKWKGGKRKF